MLTLKNCKDSSRLSRISGLCSTSAEFVDLLNDAVRMLMNRGDWYATVQKVTACIYNSCITWPREVSSVLAINLCGQSVPLSNHWYEFNQPARNDIVDYWALGCCGRVRGTNGDQSPVFNQISCGSGTLGVYIRFYPTHPDDAGKIITVYGVDSNGEELRSARPDGTVQNGIETTLAIPFGTMPASDRNVPTVRAITRIVKEETLGPVYGYQYDAAADLMYDLCRYEASETNPWYETTVLSGFGPQQTGAVPRTITALVKIKFIPAVNDNDLVGIDNIDAIAQMMQALKLGDAYDPKQKREMEAEAVRELNLELRRTYPLNQIPVTTSPFGTALPSRHGVGRFT